MTQSVIEIECLEGELMPQEVWKDHNIEMIIRKHTDTGMIMHLTRMVGDSHGLYFDPSTFMYQIRAGSFWTIEHWYKGNYNKVISFVPEYDDVFTLEQMNANREDAIQYNLKQKESLPND